MQSDFSDACKAARARIPVPAPPLAAIRDAALVRPAPRTPMRRAAVAAFFAGASVVAVAAAAEVWSGTHVQFDRSGVVQLSADTLVFKQHPTAGDIESAARHADFPVILPAGLPGGRGPTALGQAGTSAILLQYDLPGGWRRANHLAVIVLANPKTVAAPGNALRYQQLGRPGSAVRMRDTATRANAHWVIGSEDVIVLSGTLRPQELAHIKSAMLARSGQAGAAR